MTLGYLTLVWGLPITAGCGSIIAVHHWGLTRCLQACAAALWAAGIAWHDAKLIWSKEYRDAMKAAL